MFHKKRSKKKGVKIIRFNQISQIKVASATTVSLFPMSSV